jgi:AbrB family looped-hinge helix DNA binding protein
MSLVCSAVEPWLISICPSFTEFSTTKRQRSKRRAMNRSKACSKWGCAAISSANTIPSSPDLYGFIYGCINGRMFTMSSTIKMDESGRLVLPKALRDRLNLTSSTRLRVDVVAGRIELTPVENAAANVLGRKAGIVVLKRTGKKVDAAVAVAAERDLQEERGLRR